MKVLPLVVAAIGLASLPLRAADIVSYDFDGNLDPTVSSGYSATGFLAQGGSKAVVGLGSNSGSYGYILITKKSTSASSAVSNSQFAQFSVTPPNGQGVQLGKISFTAGRGANTSPRGVVIRTSLDGFSSNLGNVSINKTWPSTETYTVNLNMFSGGTVTFRVYAYADNPSGAESSIRFSNLAVQASNIVYPPTVTPAQKDITTSASSYTIRGKAGGTNPIIRVEVAKGSPKAVYSGANGTYSWTYPATGLRPGANIFYVRAIDSSQTAGPASRVVIRRSGTPGPTPRPSPTP